MTGLSGITETEPDALPGPVSTEKRQGKARRWYWTGSGGDLARRPEDMVLCPADGTVSRMEFEKA